MQAKTCLYRTTSLSTGEDTEPFKDMDDPRLFGDPDVEISKLELCKKSLVISGGELKKQFIFHCGSYAILKLLIKETAQGKWGDGLGFSDTFLSSLHSHSSISR